jgi:hypothetical protein
MMTRCHTYGGRYHGFRAAPILAFVGIYLLTRGAVFWGLLLLVLGLGKVVRYWTNPSRRLSRRVAADAQRFDCVVPYDENVRDGLEAVYAKHARTSAAYPQLAPTYDELIESMWIELRTTTSLSDWRRILRDVANAWPTPWAQGESPLAESMRKAQRAARQWRDAQREASGQTVL